MSPFLKACCLLCHSNRSVRTPEAKGRDILSMLLAGASGWEQITYSLSASFVCFSARYCSCSASARENSCMAGGSKWRQREKDLARLHVGLTQPQTMADHHRASHSGMLTFSPPFFGMLSQVYHHIPNGSFSASLSQHQPARHLHVPYQIL